MIEDIVLLRGCFRIFLLYDVAEALDLTTLRQTLGSRGEPVKRLFPRHTPGYVGFEELPIVERVEPIPLGTGVEAACTIKYYAYGVAVVQFEVPFECEWSALLPQAARWMDTAEIEPRARQIVQRHLEQIASAMVRSSQDWLMEDYLVIDLQEIQPPGSVRPGAAELLSGHAGEIVQSILGEVAPLSPRACEEVLQASLSYYPSDLVVIGASAAFVYDRPEDSPTTIQILEYAKMQLLEFRYYDNWMTRVLSDVYAALEQKRNVLLSRWSLPRDAKRFNTIRLDVMELTERIDNSIKFVSDTFYARVYRMAASRIGVPDYRNLVEKKLSTVGELYDFMVDRFNEARTFVLEVGVAILALLDVILLFKML